MAGPNYGVTQLLSVPSTAGIYLYKSNIGPASVLTDCGVTAADLATLPATAFLGANSPKPPRASQMTPTGSNGTFCDKAKISTLRAAGYSISQGKIKGITTASAASKVVTCYVLCDGIKYAWNMNAARYARLSADLAGLGVEAATDADRTTLVWGSTVPKPAIAAKFFAAGEGGGDTLSCFVASAKESTLPEGWKLLKPSITKQYLRQKREGQRSTLVV
ncbi:hypothetical protein NG791_28630 [Laspinema sp. D1]|uniref:hypothetical protein n=1 Tax=Laspinema palackyanum TaxID=3231601 RepID=UPI003494D9B2|nr:hypothetical protein [Laspinema sp. D2b]